MICHYPDRSPQSIAIALLLWLMEIILLLIVLCQNILMLMLGFCLAMFKKLKFGQIEYFMNLLALKVVEVFLC